MKTADFDYNLPEELIAQTPIIERDTSKLLILDRNNGNICHKKFKDIVDYLNSDDVLVINNTKVIPARLIGVKEDTKATIELLLLKELSENVWECLAKPAKRLKVGTVISFGGGVLKTEVMAKKAEGIVEIKLVYEGILYEILDMLGEMPLPPYIHEKLQEKDRYQTVYAKNIGSAAAPTAGLHFTPELLEKLKNKGIKIVEITLHVGLGTFRPVNVEDVTKHRMHSEYYEITKENADMLEDARTNKQRIIAVGTTCVRTLEAVMQKQQKFIACSGNTDIFIYPGYEFKAVKGIITNFHLPKSTLLMLVSAFCSKEKIMQAYGEAIANNYCFFSFGDAMLII